MHVLILNQYALPAGSAGITRHADLGRELVRRGHTVTIIASRFDYLARTERTSTPGAGDSGGVNFRWLDTGTYRENDAGRVSSMLRFAGAAIIAGIGIRPRPDVVIGSSPQLLAGLSAWLIAKRFRSPFVFEVRDPWPSALVDLGAIKRGGVPHRLLEMLERFLYQRANCVITAMAHADRRVAELGVDPGKCVEIPNATEVPPRISDVPPVASGIIQAERDAGRSVFTYAGAHGVSNGLGDVLSALDGLREDSNEAYQRVAVLLIGDGPDKAGLMRRAEAAHHRSIHFLDPMPKAAVLATVQASDFALVHFADAAFKQYGMSANKLYDAMAVARPVLLASPLADTPVDTARCGIRYQPGRPRNLAAALKQALALTNKERAAMGARGYDVARQTYNLSATGAQLEKTLVQLLAR